MFKKTAIAALVLGVSGVASAAMYAPAPAPACSAGNVTVPCEKSAWDLGIQALYLKAESNDASNSFNNYSAKMGWGFRLDGSYHFNTGSDATLNWTFFNAKSGDAGTAGYTKPKYNFVNFEMGQHVDVGENTDLRFHGGVQYASLKRDVVLAGATTNTEYDSYGFGPRAGLDMSYDFGNGFSLVGTTAVSLLGGKNRDVTNNATSRGVLVGTEAKVGGEYVYPMAQGDLAFNLGYQVQNVHNTGAFGSAAAADLGLHGLYLGLHWVGNA